MKKAIMIHVVKMTLAAGALAAVLAGCCCSKDCCCTAKCCETEPCCGQKSSGMNTSMTVGLGTDGVHAGGAANVGSHGVSGGAGGSMH